MKILCITSIDHIPNVKKNLELLGNCCILSKVNEQTVVEYLSNNDIDTIFTNPNKQGFILGEKTLQGITRIITASTGLNHIDMKYCNNNNIEVTSITTDYDMLRQIPSTAEHTFGLMMSLIRNIPKSFDSVKQGNWDWEPFIGKQICDLSVGIVGYGRLGTMMAKYCNAFDADVLVCDPYNKAFQYYNTKLDWMFANVDVISLHVHVNDETKYMINDDIINKATKPVYIINTSRGEIVDESAIIRGFENGKIAGYATDVLEHEFDDISKSPIIQNIDKYNIIVTPHLGGSTIGAQQIAYNRVINIAKDTK